VKESGRIVDAPGGTRQLLPTVLGSLRKAISKVSLRRKSGGELDSNQRDGTRKKKRGKLSNNSKLWITRGAEERKKGKVVRPLDF